MRPGCRPRRRRPHSGCWQGADGPKQISTLEDAGYVTVRKTGAGRNRRTHLRLSPIGRRAFGGHAAALQQIIADAETLTP